jgi:bis(5'-nucleosyl)-tetraphosphatase (symmetrical)
MRGKNRKIGQPMSTYAIGDVQGCFDELQRLLGQLRFDVSGDRLWFVGDLVNRGPKSLEVVRFVRGLGQAAVTVLGNHDLHLVAQHEGIERPRPDDTLDALLREPDAGELVEWMRQRPMMHVEGAYAMVHAGLLPQWSVATAARLAREVEAALRGSGYRSFLGNMYGSVPEAWHDGLAGWDRLRVIVNAMTRMRFCTAEGKMEFREKGTQPPAGFRAWYELRNDAHTIVCGHWSALGVRLEARLAALDSGCVWGGKLTALRLDDGALYQVACEGGLSRGGD